MREGKFCLDRTKVGITPQYKFKLKGRQSMKESAVMSWFSFRMKQELSGRQSQKMGSHTTGDFSVDNQGYLHAKYYNEELKELQKIEGR